MSIEHAERVTMQATPLNNPAGIPNDRDTADPRVIPGPDHDSGACEHDQRALQSLENVFTYDAECVDTLSMT